MTKISEKHIIVFILILTSISMKTFSNIFMMNGLRDSWISVIIASILILIFSLFLIKVCKNTETYNIKDLYYNAFGKFFGSFFLFTFLIAVFLTLIECNSGLSNSIHETMFTETPTWYISLFFTLCALYTIKKGFNSILSVSIISLFFIVISGIILFFLTLKLKHPVYLKPIFEHGITPNFILSIFQALGMYGFFTIIICFFPMLQNKKNLKKTVFISLLFIIQMQIVSITGLISSFGYKRTLNIWYPKLIQTQPVVYLNYLENSEFFTIFKLVGGMFSKYIVCFYALNKLLQDFNMYKKHSNEIISVLVFILSYFSSNNCYTLFKLLNIFNYYILITLIFIPFICCIILYVKDKFNNKKNKKSNTKNKPLKEN